MILKHLRHCHVKVEQVCVLQVAIAVGLEVMTEVRHGPGASDRGVVVVKPSMAVRTLTEVVMYPEAETNKPVWYSDRLTVSICMLESVRDAGQQQAEHGCQKPATYSTCV